MVEKSVYNSTLSIIFSPCKHFLVVGNIYGDIGVFLMKDIFLPREEWLTAEKKPKRILSTPGNDKVNSLAASKRFLIAGTVGEIYAWDWASLPKKDLKISWNISIPYQRDSYLKPDVNTLVLSNDSDSPFLFAGCGDNIIYMFSLEDGREIRAFESHTDYIHSLSSCGPELVSSSEDGSVKLWDTRQASVTLNAIPSSLDQLARPELGVWVGDVSINSTKLVCGGGPKASLWDVRRLTYGVPLDSPDKGVHVCKLFGRNIVVSGVTGVISVFDSKTDGEFVVKLPSSSHVVYSAQVIENSTSEIMVFGGASNNIDVCSLKKRFHILTFL